MLVPWRYVKSWSCRACGHCCQDYAIPLAEDEGRSFVNLFGPSIVEKIRDKVYLRRGEGGRCHFQRRCAGQWLCGIQGAKPVACKLFPFKICTQPLYGRAEEALYRPIGNDMKKTFIYVDADCRGIVWGAPGADFLHEVLPEFVDLRLKEREGQFFSTARIHPRNFLPVRSSRSACTIVDLPLAVTE
jgi:Fe-S-cluster containining protein